MSEAWRQLGVADQAEFLDWAQTGTGQGQTGCIVHTLQAVSDTQLYRGSCTLWNVALITFPK